MEFNKNDELVAFFNKHVIQLVLKVNKSFIDLNNVFILSAEDEWFLVTAGHVGLSIKEFLQDQQISSKEVFLYDAGGLEAKYYDPIPFDLTPDKILILGDENTRDYAIIHLRPHYKSLLRANGIEPLNEEVWCRQPQDPDFYLIVGVPTEMVLYEWNSAKSEINSIKPATTLLPVDHVPQLPDGLKEKSFPRWYGYVTIAPPINDIKGISGSPIFAFKYMDNGELRYWLIGVQSSWNKSTKAIAACPAKYLGDFLASGVRKYKEEFLQNKV